jgi:hypothetical protein
MSDDDDPRMAKLQELTADFISLCLIAKAGTLSSEQRRLWSMAVDAIREAESFAFKAVMWRDE